MLAKLYIYSKYHQSILFVLGMHKFLNLSVMVKIGYLIAHDHFPCFYTKTSKGVLCKGGILCKAVL